jgi:hypothetical protein
MPVPADNQRAVCFISFDTVSQAACLALTAAEVAGLWHAFVLALLFGGGMVASDAANGMWISRLIAPADWIAPVARRVIAGFGTAQLLLPMIAERSDERRREPRRSRAGARSTGGKWLGD